MEDQVTEEQLSDISDEVGACYRRLAPKLDIKDCKIQNIEDENRRNADRAHAILMEWKKRKGSEATVQALAKILTGLDMKHITDMLLPGNFVICVGIISYGFAEASHCKKDQDLA